MMADDWKRRLLPLLVLWFSCTVAAFDGTVVLSTADPDWKYDNGSVEFPPGAQGGLVRKNEFLRLDGNFGRGGRYVSATLAMKLPEARELRFKVRSSAARLTVLLGGADGKVRRVEQSLNGGAPEFRESSVPLDDAALTSVGFLLNQNDLSTDDGFLEISGVRLTGVADGKFVPVCRADSPDSYFITPGGRPFRLAVLAGPETFSPETLRFRWLDYTGKEAAAGAAAFDAATRVISVPAPAATGYYELEFPGSGIRSAVVAAEPYAGVMDGFFGIDLPSGTNDFPGLMRLLHRCGIGWCRDRMAWPGSSVEERYGALRAAAATEDISVLDTFEEGALRSRSSENLVETARNFALFAVRPDCGKAVEIASAPGEGIPPEFEIAPLRAVSSRFVLDKISLTLAGGDGAIVPDDPMLDVYRMYVSVGLLDDIDVLSFTAREPAVGLEEKIALMREIEKTIRNSRTGIPYWVSGADGADPVELVVRAVELRALGGAKYFPAAAGMAGANRAPLRPFGVYAYLPRVLAFKEYVGDLKIEGATRSRAFSDGREAVVCLFLAGDAKELHLPEGLKVLRAAGIDGRPLEIRNGVVPMGDRVVFLYPDPAGFAAFLDEDTPAMKLRKIALGFKPAVHSAKPVVIQPGYDPATGIRDRIASRALCGEPTSYRVFFSNLSDQTVAVEPYLNLPGGVRAIEAPVVPAGGKVERPKLELLPGARMEYDFSVLFDPALGRRSPMTFPVGDRGGKASSLVIAVNPYDRARVEVSLTGKLSDWIDFSSLSNWDSGLQLPADIRAKFRISARPSRLRFEIEVREEVRPEGDGIRFALQLRRNPDDCSGPLFRFDSAHPASGVRSVFSRPGNGISRYVIDVPPSAFGVPALEKGMSLGVFLAADSGSGKELRGTLSWGEGIGEKTIPQLFQLLVF